MGKVYAVGVGPGSPKYVTEIVKEIILNCDIVVGYKYTLKTIENLIEGKEIYEITMKDQEEYYQKIVSKLGDRILVIPFTGDVNFSESEVVDRLIEIFGEVEIIPGISSIQVAASRAQVPLDKSKVITMHVTTPIEDKKLELQKALIDGFSVVLVPRPWPNQPNKHFMASEIAVYLREHGFDTAKIKVHVFEAITTENETSFVGTVKDLEGKEFSDLSIIVFNQTSLDSYMNYRWQWKN
ncbi:precorrin-6y C5,15-methyltransferase (decarboxylating) subunit CbiE [Marine Group I thaumarchaeote]|uniref:Precorrin-6y C5,15-methyltransferase (Decarboxylating) subunit CbiE n=3 Tax=Marine Group I thaumarchaeote TaxID=2511932 RepID=A0A7K4MSN8_9ARCH|nr:precorrin-6y C5,15-methyltransferase (decarboxylating) subunit CbiE [Candidatus Nitrosopumilus sp. MTA1]NWJ19888.1 precorrin-6y C5,15-methyltransferase (decarboxylating) subunit CbiE [Marine Group I thaumarchaeote]NWJ56505.1 precorrin-6y C5,15-methyltransferase (decarboxylating) subunit CbiE [Marine Group I thaumarchaeote]NWJ83228.1 precorrin-6y C5,15-methyltransferase (decarboxylating) subunit CbiE [Marine Group I thaumarchaeote]NWK00845.1 precorrin-6y C5,15-methyltransferase (decarboxylati